MLRTLYDAAVAGEIEQDHIPLGYLARGQRGKGRGVELFHDRLSMP